jgi:general secretion pathway protein C
VVESEGREGRTEMLLFARFRKRFWLLNLITVLLCGFFGARAAGQYLTSNLDRTSSVTVPSRQSGTRSEQLSSAAPRDTVNIVTRNIFCSSCAPAQPLPDETSASGAGQPSRTALPLRLLATLVSPESEEDGFAALLDTGSGRTRMAAVGEMLALEARLIAVEERRILLENCPSPPSATGRNQNACREEFLPLDEPTPGEGGRKQPEPAKPTDQAASASVRLVAPGRYEIPREALNQALSNTAQIAAAARIMPSQSQGQSAGFMLTAIRPGSLYTQLGLKDGDIIQAVNGRPLRTVEDAMQLFTGLRSAQHITISLMRRSQPITHDYTVTNR